MKIALYIEDGLEQIVLTPESDTEKGILVKMHDGSRQLDIKKGEFYACRGGWVRHGMYTTRSLYGNDDSDVSTMIILRVPPMSEPTRAPDVIQFTQEQGEEE